MPRVAPEPQVARPCFSAKSGWFPLGEHPAVRVAPRPPAAPGLERLHGPSLPRCPAGACSRETPLMLFTGALTPLTPLLANARLQGRRADLELQSRRGKEEPEEVEQQQRRAWLW